MMLLLLMMSLGVRTDALGVSRMAGGTGAAPGQFPHLVFVVASRVSVSYCSGSILTETWVLTAAHCVLVPDLKSLLPPGDFKLYAGILDYYTQPRPHSAQVVRGKDYVIHPGYRLFNATNYTDLGSYNDLALIETATAFFLNEMVQPIPLSESPSPLGRVRCEVAGFGDTERGSTKSLRYMTIREIQTCSEVEHQELNYFYRNDEYLCCFSQAGSFTKPGDSGAPLQCHGVLVGVNFWVKPLHGNTYIIIISDVFHSLDWILSHVSQLTAHYLDM